MRRVLMVALGCLCGVMSALAQQKVVDSETGEPIIAAQVIGNDGALLGTTNENGFLPKESLGEDTISLQHISYQPVTIALKGRRDPIRMIPMVYKVPEITAANKKHDIIHLVGYYRAYNVGDTIGIFVKKKNDPNRKRSLAAKFYSEGKVELFFDADDSELDHFKFKPMRKMKWMKGEEMKEHAEKHGGTPLFFRLCTPDMVKALNRFRQGNGSVNLPSRKKKMQGGNITYGPEKTRIYYDDIAKRGGKPHGIWGLRLLGVNIKVPVLNENSYFRTSKGKFSAVQMLSLQRNITVDVMVRGKRGMHADMYAEFFVTEAEYLTKREYRKMKKTEVDLRGFRVPEGVPGLPAPISASLQKMEKY